MGVSALEEQRGEASAPSFGTLDTSLPSDEELLPADERRESRREAGLGPRSPVLGPAWLVPGPPSATMPCPLPALRRLRAINRVFLGPMK